MSRRPVGGGRYDEAPEVIETHQTLVNAFSSGSALGTQYALENAVPLFAETLQP